MVCDDKLFALDASVLITFGKNGEFRVIEEIFDGRGYVADEVYDECRSIRNMLDSAISTGSLLQHSISEAADLAFFGQVRLRMDPGEAAAVTSAKALGAYVVSDDRDAIIVGRNLLGNNRVIGTQDVLCLAVGHSMLTATQAEVHMSTFIAGGAFLPDPDPEYFGRCGRVPAPIHEL